jgi:hypothetical protein
MDSVDHMIREALRSPTTNDNGSCLSAEGFQTLSQCALLPRILQAYILEGREYFELLSLFKIHIRLDISWADLRAAMCPLRHIIGCADPKGVCRLLWFVAQHLSPEIAIAKLFLELVQGVLRQMKDNGILKV